MSGDFSARILKARTLTALFVAAPLSLALVGGCSSSGPVAFTGASEEELALAEEISLHELSQHVPIEDGIDARRDLAVRLVGVDELRMAHTRVQQTYKGVPVFGGEAIVHLSTDGTLFALTDTLVRGVRRDLDVRPSIERAAAIDAVLGEYGCDNCLTEEPKSDLFVFRHQGEDRLAYRVALHRESEEDTSMPVVFIDAHSGQKIFEYDNLQTATGISLYSGTVEINTYQKSGTYYLEDVSRKLVTRDNKNTPGALLALLGFAGTTSDVTSATDVWGAAAVNAQNAAVEAHYASAKVYDYYKDVHGRTGIDGSDGPGTYTSHDGSTKLVVSRVHYSSKYNNAFWDGSKMTYGDGDGTTFRPLISLDICGHEMTHGVTERTANLTYSGESGALNEAISDIMGAMVERSVRGESANTWLVGEDVFTPATADDALRYMDEPHRAADNGFTADDDPCHYSERYTGTGDNGGVHINSGIVNKMFYLLAAGGSHHLGGSMTGIGAEKAAAIVYKALTTYMTASTNFAQARAAMINASNALYGNESAESAAVAQAWSLVGVS